MQKTEVVIFSEDFPPKDGGIAQWAMGVAREFHNMGMEVHLLTRFWNQEYKTVQDSEPYHVVQVKGKRWKQFRSLYARKALKALIEQGAKPKVIIATTANIARGLIGLSKSIGAELVVVVHGLEVTRKMNWLKFQVVKKTLHVAQCVVAVSRFTAERTQERYQLSSQHIFVLPNGVNPDMFFPQEVPNSYKEKLGIEGKKVILTLARLQERKGHDKVIEAMPAVLKVIPNAVYLISGKPKGEYYERLNSLVQTLGLEKEVKFIGYVPQNDLTLIYNCCDLYIMPSRELASQGDTEGFGITYLEANGCAKPVIGGRSGGVVDAIEDGVNGFLVDPLSNDDIAEKLIKILSNEAFAHQMGRTARARVLNEFSWEKISRHLAEKLALI